MQDIEDKERYYQHGAAPGKRVDKTCGSTEKYGDDDFGYCHGAKLRSKSLKFNSLFKFCSTKFYRCLITSRSG